MPQNQGIEVEKRKDDRRPYRVALENLYAGQPPEEATERARRILGFFKVYCRQDEPHGPSQNCRL